jgi:hypothetical protein
MTVDGDSPSEAAGRMERQGKVLNAEEIEGMRKVCKVRPNPRKPLSACDLTSSGT